MHANSLSYSQPPLHRVEQSFINAAASMAGPQLYTFGDTADNGLLKDHSSDNTARLSLMKNRRRLLCGGRAARKLRVHQSILHVSDLKFARRRNKLARFARFSARAHV